MTRQTRIPQREKAENFDRLRETANAKGYVTAAEAIDAAPGKEGR